MSKPKFEIIIQSVCPADHAGSPDCKNCEMADRCEADEGALEPTPAEKIAALLLELEKLTGAKWQRHPGREKILAKFKGRKGYHEKDKPKEADR